MLSGGDVDSSEDGKLADWGGTQTSSHCPHGAVENYVQLFRVGTSTPDRSTVSKCSAAE